MGIDYLVTCYGTFSGDYVAILDPLRCVDLQVRNTPAKAKQLFLNSVFLVGMDYLVTCYRTCSVESVTILDPFRYVDLQVRNTCKGEKGEIYVLLGNIFCLPDSGECSMISLLYYTRRGGTSCGEEQLFFNQGFANCVLLFW